MQESMMLEKEKKEEKTEPQTQDKKTESTEVKTSEKIEGYWDSVQEFLVNLP